MSSSSKRTGLLATGIVVLIVGVLAALGLWISSGQRESDAVRNLARAPIGCDTTLDFDATGEYFVYVESAGQFDGDVSGDCGATGEYEVSGDDLPPVTLTLTDPSGDDVALDSRAGISYDTAGYVGTSVRSFTVDETGDHRLRVETPGSSGVAFAAAVGRNPSDGVASMRLGAVLAGLGGLVIGGLLVLLSRRGSNDEPALTEDVWSGQVTGWPTSPPGMPVAPPTGASAPVGPPTQYPLPPEPAAPPPPPGGGWPPQVAPSPGQSGQPNAPTWGGATNDGSSGDGQRSPWAPPSDGPR